MRKKQESDVMSIQNEDFFAQRQIHHLNKSHPTISDGDDFLGLDSGLNGQSDSIDSDYYRNSYSTDGTGRGVANSSGENDLLGLSASSNSVAAGASASASAGAGAAQQSNNSEASNELLGLSYKYDLPKPLPTADLLGFDSSDDFNGERTPQSVSEDSNIELLSLDFNPEITNPCNTKTCMKINDAYVALEQMRVANLEIEFGHNIDTSKCVQCVRQMPPNQVRKKYGPTSSYFSSVGKSFRFKHDKPCMMCGSPTCKKHSDPNFLKSKIVICTECSPLFSLEFILECVCLNIAAEGDEEEKSEEEKKHSDDEDDTNNKNDSGEATYGRIVQTCSSHDSAASVSSQKTQHTKRIFQPKNSIPLSPKEQLQKRNIKHMVDVYDRVHLMLTYSAEFIDEIATKLEANTRREDKVGLSSNSIGIASGLAGIAAAAAVVTPAGPPLIIASLLFGATSQASASGSKLVNYYSAPNKIALKIISYYNLLKSILVVTNVLRDALLEDNIDVEKYVSRMVKAHDEAMIQLSLSTDDDEAREGGEDDETDNVVDTFAANDTTPKSQDEIEFEDDWETDDSTVMSMRSKSSMVITTTNHTLQGIQENKKCSPEHSNDDDNFGDFQQADSIDTNSLASTPHNLNSLSPSHNFTFSPTAGTPNANAPATGTPNADGDSNGAPSPDQEKEKNDTSNKGNKGSSSNIEALMERKDTAGKLARFYSRTSLAGSSLVGAATVTVFAGAALSLAHVAFEANNFASTIKRLQAGSPSKRAKILRAIKKDIENIPNTSVIAEEWEKYLGVLDERRRNKGNMKS